MLAPTAPHRPDSGQVGRRLTGIKDAARALAEHGGQVQKESAIVEFQVQLSAVPADTDRLEAMLEAEDPAAVSELDGHGRAPFQWSQLALRAFGPP